MNTRSGQGTYHGKDKCKQICGYWVEVAVKLDAIRLAVFKQRILEDVSNDMMFTEACNLLLVLRFDQYNSKNVM